MGILFFLHITITSQKNDLTDNLAYHDRAGAAGCLLLPPAHQLCLRRQFIISCKPNSGRRQFIISCKPNSGLPHSFHDWVTSSRQILDPSLPTVGLLPLPSQHRIAQRRCCCFAEVNAAGQQPASRKQHEQETSCWFQHGHSSAVGDLARGAAYYAPGQCLH